MKFTKSLASGILAVAIVAFALTSCIKEETVSNKEREKISLEAWIKLNKPEILNNKQEDGGYYVEILEGDKNENLPISADGNDFGSEPLMDQDTCWVYCNMTGRDINGAICMTRSSMYAQMCGTFSYSTHYVPYMTYCGSNNMGLLEGTYLSMRHELVLSDEYREWYYNKYNVNLDNTYKMRRGSKVRLYLPSTIAYGESGSQTEGGYEGQYSLDSSRPLILDIEVLGAIKNPSDKELSMIKSYIGWEDPWIQAEKNESEKNSEDEDLKLTGLYYSYAFNPETDNTFTYRYMQPHLNGTNNPYTDNKRYGEGGMPDLNQQINDILLKRFGKGLDASQRSEKTQVTKDGRANVWYILRFLDGFIADTNIAEIRTLVFGEQDPVCEVFSYSPSDDDGKGDGERQAIGAWYYCIPQMHYGAYGQIVTTSGYAYGAAGMSGTTTTETSSSSAASYYNAMNYYNYYNSYYNYYSPYYNYYDYSYYNYNYNYDSSEETTTTTTISTEILPYTPLVFTLYVEPNE